MSDIPPPPDLPDPPAAGSEPEGPSNLPSLRGPVIAAVVLIVLLIIGAVATAIALT